jgi:hypothetical protein
MLFFKSIGITRKTAIYGGAAVALDTQHQQHRNNAPKRRKTAKFRQPASTAKTAQHQQHRNNGGGWMLHQRRAA